MSTMGGTNMGVATHVKISINKEVRTHDNWQLVGGSESTEIKGSA